MANHPLRILSLAIVAVALAATVDAQPREADAVRAGLELEKLRLEIAALRSPFTTWANSVLGLVAGLVAAGSTLWIARYARFGTLDQSVHDERLEKYPGLVQATAPLAIYFPEYVIRSGSLGPLQCMEMGRDMATWYFGSGGLLLSQDARAAYFNLARALTKASLALDLRVPTFSNHAQEISSGKLADYRVQLEFATDATAVEEWCFGEQPQAQRRTRGVSIVSFFSPLRR